MALHYGGGMDFEERTALLTKRLAALDHVKQWKQLVRAELARPEYPVEQVQSLRPSSTFENPLLPCLLEKMGLLALIKRTVIDLHCEAIQTVVVAHKKQVTLTMEHNKHLPEPPMNGCNLDVVRAARDNWERITSDEMLKLAKELGRPLVDLNSEMPPSGTDTAPRSDGQPPGLTSQEIDSVMPSKPTKPLAARFLYDGNDLLNALQAIEPLNRMHDSPEAATDSWGSIKLQLFSPPFPEYRRLFSELTMGCGHIGLDEFYPAQRGIFLAEKNRVGDLVLAHQSVSMARQYSKTGCPVSLRPQIWRQVLSVSISAQDRSYFNNLKQQVSQLAYLTDDMYLLDLQQTIDSSDYFVFQDHLESVLMAFTRDTYVLDHALQVNGAVHYSINLDTHADTILPPQQAEVVRAADRRVPPNGVLPFSGLVMYMAPLAYLYADPVEIYYVFRELYVRYWSKLNAIRTERGTILPLCKLFEDLIVRSSPAAVFHLINIGLKPLDIAYPWIQSAFSGVLDIDQVLLLWDRIIGYDSLELIAIFAAALFHFRSSELEHVASREEADELFTELIDIQVVPLLQDYLF